MIKEVHLPEISENVETGDVIEVLVAVGDVIEQEQSIVELETEKATFEVPSSVAGRVVEVNVKAGQKINVGHVIIKVETEVAAPVAEAPAEQKPPAVEKEHVIEQARPEPAVAQPIRRPGKQVAASPSVRQLARELGIDVGMVAGTGPGGRISQDDVKNYAMRIVTGALAPAAVAPVMRALPDFSKLGEIERQAMSTTRKVIAENLSATWSSIPQVTQQGTADITELLEFRREYAKQVEEAGGRLTVTSMLVKVVASGLKVFPKFNASVDEGRNEIILKKYYNISVAVDTDRGLLVPVIRDVDKKNILQLSVELNELARKTRDKKVQPPDLAGGNFTVSNLGGIAGTYFSPILNWPEVAILGIGRAAEQPVYIDGHIQPRSILPLSLSYDHRVIDGADGARFLKWIIQSLEEPFLLAMKE